MADQLHILLPDTFLSEKLYVLDVLLKEYLNISYTVEISKPDSNYLFVLPNGNRIVFKNDFFVNFNEDQGFLQKENIPLFVNKMTNSLTPENQLPVIFGNDELKFSRGEEKEAIVCGLDIIASIFFMLTRWEEYANPIRDDFGRFPAKSSLAVKHKFILRPVVNEYCLMLEQIFLHLGFADFTPAFSFKIIPTHDVDRLLYFNGFTGFMRKIAAAALKRGDFRDVYNNLKLYYQVLLHKKPDPYDTFNELMSVSEENGWQSAFYFLTGFDKRAEQSYNLNSSYGQRLIGWITERGHKIGFHPGFNTADHSEAFGSQLIKLQNLLPQPGTQSRQHFLQFTAPRTWQIAEENGLILDSTLGYSETEGFRTGTCFPYAVYDFINRKKLNLKESPLIAMDTTLVLQKKYSPEKCYDQLSHLARTVKRYSGELVILWHNSNWELPPFNQYKEVYRTILKFR